MEPDFHSYIRWRFFAILNMSVGISKRDELIDFLPIVAYKGGCMGRIDTYRELHNKKLDEEVRKIPGGRAGLL